MPRPRKLYGALALPPRPPRAGRVLRGSRPRCARTASRPFARSRVRGRPPETRGHMEAQRDVALFPDVCRRFQSHPALHVLHTSSAEPARCSKCSATTSGVSRSCTIRTTRKTWAISASNASLTWRPVSSPAATTAKAWPASDVQTPNAVTSTSVPSPAKASSSVHRAVKSEHSCSPSTSMSSCCSPYPIANSSSPLGPDCPRP